VKSNCYNISHKLFSYAVPEQRAYGNKLKTTYGRVINYFFKPSQTVLQVHVPVDKLKYVNPSRP